ncbi:MAG: hypothetical protein B6I22_07110 [Desulfobacteraceae bacterium 4572_123]|nr:MAG: hypothetical protein B6I22_07110 [Desulfobacteraceae bacterium 4572_123]
MIPHVKIIIVDDDKITRDLLVDVLTYSVNRKILTFETGSDAWAHLQRDDSADIIIFDVNIPEINGFELLGKIKQNFSNKTCILLSPSPADEKTAGSLGADAFLAKPFSVNDLFNIVQTFVVESGDR